MTESLQQQQVEQEINESTKVYYHLDDSATCYMSEVPASFVTLGDFKKIFKRKGYTYFCKEWDPYLNIEVKVEIKDDRQVLHKAINGLIELFLLSTHTYNTCTMGAGTISMSYNADTVPKIKTTSRNNDKTKIGTNLLHIGNYSHHIPQVDKSAVKISSSGHMDIYSGQQRISFVTAGTEASSDIQTLISKRAGENLAEYNSTSEDPYNNRTSISSSEIYQQNNRHPGVSMPSAADSINESISAIVDKTLLATSTTSINVSKQSKQHRPKNKQRYRKPYVPSTISSESENSSYSLPRIEEIKIRLQEAPLGIKKVACLDGSIFISYIEKGSAAENYFEIGDQIIQVDDTRFDDLNEKQALELLKKLNSLKKTVTIYVAKRAHINGESSEEQRSDVLSLLYETTQHLDINEWVESTKKKCAEEFIVKIYDKEEILEQGIPVTATKTTAYNVHCIADFDRVEIKSNIPSTSCPIILDNLPIELTVSTLLPPQVQQPLHAEMDPLLILLRMVELDSGLMIRDRKWLKIPVPHSFIGEEMIDWLLINVQGFHDRKKARAFASDLLAKGLIKHVVNVNAFSEKCYFIFDDSIIANRISKLKQQKHQQNELQQKRQNLCQQEQQQTTSKKSAAMSGVNSQLEANSAGTTSEIANDTAEILCTGPSIGGHESTTEITYMSNPSSPFFGILPAAKHSITRPPPPVIANNPHYLPGSTVFSRRFIDNNLQHVNGKLNNNDNLNNNNSIAQHTLNPPKFGTQLPIWPISPIPFGPTTNTQVLMGQKQPPTTIVCEESESLSATTNDYASMIQGDINSGVKFDITNDEIRQQLSTATTNQKSAHQNSLASAAYSTNNNSLHTIKTTAAQQQFQTPNACLPSAPLFPKRQQRQLLSNFYKC